MKTTLFQVGKQGVFSEFYEDLLDIFYIISADVFGVKQDVIEVNNDKNIKFFC